MLTHACKNGIFVNINGYEVSQSIDLRNIGVYGSLQMKELNPKQK